MRPLGRGLRAGQNRYTLRLLREAVGATQASVASASGIYQGDVSKLEGKAVLDEVLVSTLRRYVRAVGGEVEVVVVLNGRRYRLEG